MGLADEIAKKRKAAKEKANTKKQKPDSLNTDDVADAPNEVLKGTVSAEQEFLRSVADDKLEKSLKIFEGEDSSLSKEDQLRKLDLLVKTEQRNDAYKAYLDEESSASPVITLENIGDIDTNKRQLELQVRLALKDIISLWEAMPQEPPEPYTVGMLREVKRDIVKLLYKLRAGKLENSILLSLATVIYYIQQKNFVKANESYMKLSIGNVAYPIGIRDVGIHARHALLKITGEDKSTIANVMKSESFRKWILAVKRLISYSETRMNSTKVSKEPESQVTRNSFSKPQ
ncbi:hypothetical protein C7M61_001657 [Candidozyma pseudohaemuli]|uniref:Pre-mRNA-splicing factor 18 n=1 Tax=Candidozyma pseudohaemuli TaxID=418784 RepID=A0A2P7YV48_9ASCO|nr:hypothetical protein C7M61_001657 [[Candida] pseudohaemulonii]PSK39848.1 hypothetical protein C7M61_001657 [[Candida] pseudohaemulonii]